MISVSFMPKCFLSPFLNCDILSKSNTLCGNSFQCFTVHGKKRIRAESFLFVDVGRLTHEFFFVDARVFSNKVSNRCPPVSDLF